MADLGNRIVPGMSLDRTSDLQEVRKALGYGDFTTDVSLLSQGGAGSYESLDRVVAEMTWQDGDFKFLDSMRVTQAGQPLDQWLDTTSIGGKYGDSISNDVGTTVEGTSEFDRRTLYMKYFTQRGGISRVLLKSPNFLQELNQEDVKAIRRIKRDISRLLWEGNKDIVADEFDGFKAIATDVNRGNYDGEHVADLWYNSFYSGLDSDGFSNPGDLEAAAVSLASHVSRPQNGSGKLTDAYMSVDVRHDVNQYKNWQPYQILSGGPNPITTGALVQGWANPFGGSSMMTKINMDQFIPDGEYLKAAEARSEADASFAAPASVTTATTTDASTKFTSAFYGTVRYWVAALGRGRESFTTAPAAAVTISSAANKVTLTITQSAGGAEKGYAIYRGSVNGANDVQDARLIKKVKKAGTTTTFVDLNHELPGAQTVYYLPKEDPEAFDWRQLFGFFRVELPIDAQAIFLVPFAIAVSGALRVKKPRHLAVAVNYISRASGWSPTKGTSF